MSEPIARLEAEDIARNITEIDSLCMNCREQGQTRLLPTRIPYFREVIVTSFSCPHCGFENCELMPAASYDDLGMRFELKVETKADLNRQVAQAKFATIRIPELDLEVPSTRGNLTTVEGVLRQVVENLRDLIARTRDDESQRETVVKLIEFVTRALKLLDLDSNDRITTTWTLQLLDPTGTSFIENPNAPHRDERLRLFRYRRTAADNELIGLSEPTTDSNGHTNGDSAHAETLESESGFAASNEVEMPENKKRRMDNAECAQEDDRADNLMRTEAVEFTVQCGACKSNSCVTRMKTVPVPHFRDVIVMATTCDACGWRDAEVKSGGAMQPRGVRFTVRIDERDDLNRMVLRSETAGVLLPELDFESSASCAASKLTTVEGVLSEIRDHLLSTVERTATKQTETSADASAKQRNETLLFGDSLDSQQLDRIRAFCSRIDDIIQLRMPGVHVVIDDSAGNSFVAFATDNPEDDLRLKRTEYERDAEQNEALGITDMKVDNY